MAERGATTILEVPRRTGTAGDELIGWGLARVMAGAIGETVVLLDAGARLAVEIPLDAAELDEALGEPHSVDAARLRWLEDSTKAKRAPAGVASVDFAALKEAKRVVGEMREQARKAGTVAAVAEPSVTTRADAALHPLYLPLTNPGPQWKGYNGLAEATRLFAEPVGLRLLAARFRADGALADDALDEALKQAGVKSADRWRNPPGFLFSGLNKGPTRPVALWKSVTVGDGKRWDAEMADRGDLSVAELFLAYVGYFSVVRVLGSKAGRMVLVPAPLRVSVPRGLEIARRAVVPSSVDQDYVAASASLAYAAEAVAYLSDLRQKDPEEARRQGTVLRGVALAQYWMPSGNVFAPIRTGLAPLPGWLATLHREGWEVARETLERHRQQLRSVRGRTRDERLSGVQRDVFRAYRASLDGDAGDWLRAVLLWLPALREAARGGTFKPWPWQIDEVRRVTVALAPRLADVVDRPAFQAVSAAIRAATLRAHLDRQRAREGGPRAVFEPEYDLVSGMAAAADRSSEEFVAELCRFVARFNDATMRRNADAPRGMRRSFVRDEELREVIGLLQEDRRGTVAAALLAFGTSLRGARGAPASQPPAGDDEGEPADDGTETETDTEGEE